MVMKRKRQSIEVQRGHLIRKLGHLQPWMEGTVVVTRRICGSMGCACRHGGEKHPAMYVTWKEKGKTVSIYVLRDREKNVVRWAKEWKRLKTLIREGTRLSRELIRLRES